MKEKDRSQAIWTKSSYSSGNGQCVEAALVGATVATRDSKDPQGPVLVFSADAWHAFIKDVKTGRYA